MDLTLDLQAASSRPTVDLGLVDCIPRGEGRAYSIANRTIAVFHTRDGELFALDDRCPLGGGPLANGWLGEPRTVVCPEHARAFELSSGRCLEGGVAVRTYPVFAVDGRIQVMLDGES